MRAMDDQKTTIKIVLIVCLAVALCLMPCGVAGQHHASMGTPSIFCAVDLPQLFQLVIVMNLLLFALVTPIIVPQPPAFSLLKPPRFAFS